MSNLASQRLHWTYAEIKFLKDNYGKQGAWWCGDKLGRTTHAVELKARKLGLHFYTHYKELEDDLLRELWNNNVSTKKIAKKLGRTEISIRSRKLRLGLPQRPQGRRKEDD